MHSNRFHKLMIAALFAGQAALTLAQGYPPTYSSSATYTEGDVVRIGINQYRALNTNTNKSPLNYTGSWELYRVRANNTASPPVYRIYVGVGHSFTNLYTAWNYIANAVIDKGATVQLDVDTSHGALNENFSAPFNLDQPCGARIQIVGDNVSKINLTFTNATDGIDIDSGNSLGLLESVQISSTNASAQVGISLDAASSMHLANVNVSNFPTGVQVSNASRLFCAGFSSINISSYVTGISATNSSYVSCQYASLTGTAMTGKAIYADQHSEIDASFGYVAVASYAYYCAGGSTIIAQVASSISAATYDYYVSTRGYIDATSSSGGAYRAETGGFISALSSTASMYSTDSGFGSYIDH